MQIFRDESAERLDRMTDVLLAAERTGAADADAVAELFRDAHSIRGSAGMFGFAGIGDLATAMEDVLAVARTAGRLEGADAAGLLAAADAIRAALAGDESLLEPAGTALRAGRPESDAAAGADDAPTPSGAPAPAPAPAPPDDPPTADDAPPAPAPLPPPPPASSPGPPPAGPPSPAAGVPRPADPAAEATRTMRVAAAKVDQLLAVTGEAALGLGRLEHRVRNAGLADEGVLQELDQGETIVAELQDAVLALRTLPLRTITDPLPRAVRDIAAAADRDVRLDLEGMETPLDRSVLDGIAEALVHLLRNAISHGIEAPEDRRAAGKPETGRILLRAEQRGGQVRVSCTDDGRGVPQALVDRAAARGVPLADVLAEAGTSTGGASSSLSGRGVGLDAVKRHVEGLGGQLEASSEPGRGSTISLLLPLTLAIMQLLVVERGGQRFAVALGSVEEAVVEPRVEELEGRCYVRHADAALPLADLADLIGQSAPALAPDAPTLVLRAAGARAAVTCDRLVGDREAVTKPLGPILGGVPGYLGATMLPDGTIALLLDPAHLVRAAARTTPGARAVDAVPVVPHVLVVDDQFTVRELQRSILESAGYRVSVAADGRDALAIVDADEDVDLVVTDIEMPVMDGLALLETLRARPATRSLPVVIVSSVSDERARLRGAEAGADAWVVKAQFDQRSLLDTVGRLIDLR
nr:response regulator [Patulibacter sp. SYSU D01012]